MKVFTFIFNIGKRKTYNVFSKGNHAFTKPKTTMTTKQLTLLASLKQAVATLRNLTPKYPKYPYDEKGYMLFTPPAKPSKKGFTLIETLAVITLIVILSALFINRVIAGVSDFKAATENPTSQIGRVFAQSASNNAIMGSMMAELTKTNTID